MIRKSHAVKFWICCTLEETNGQRVVFDTPGRYTPLFFWDEAVAMAAGHRPCGQCRKTAFRGFKQALNRSKGLPDDHFLSVKEIDAEMHTSRLDDKRRQRRYRAIIGDLPPGTFVTFDSDPNTPRLLWNGKSHAWSHDGYETGVEYERSREVEVLTPLILVETIKAGYAPMVRLPPAPLSQGTSE